MVLIIFIQFGFPLEAEDNKDSLENSLNELLNIKISSAAKYEQRIIDAPASITIITSEEISRNGYQNLSEALMSLPGFYQHDDLNYTYLGTRGFDLPSTYGNKVLLMLNGHILNDNIFGSIYIGNDLALNMQTIEKIEVVQGPGSALYGTGAMLAVINIKTKDGNLIDGNSLNFNIGSSGKYEGMYQFGRMISDGINLSISTKAGIIKGENYYFREFDTDSTNHGNASGIDGEQYFSGLASLQSKDFNLNLFYVSRQKMIPTAPWGVIFNKPNTKTLDNRGYIDFVYNKKISPKHSLKFDVYMDYYYSYGDYQNVIPEEESYEGIWMGTELQYLWDISSNNRLNIGLEDKYSFRTDIKIWQQDSFLFNHNYPYNIFSLYLQDQYQILENFSISGGFRFDNNKLFGNSISPRFSINYNPNKSSTIKLLIGQAFRAPNTYELYYKDDLTQKANLNLQPEKILTSELLYEQNIRKNILFKISLYDYFMEKLIDQYIDSTDNLLQFQNLKKVNAYGIEFEIKTKWDCDLWAYLNYSYQKTKDYDTQQELANSPNHIFKGGLSYNFVKQLMLSVESLYETNRITVYGYQTEPYFLTNAYISMKPVIKETEGIFSFLINTNLSLKLNNIFNRKYALPGGLEHIQIAIPQKGFNFLFEVTYNF